MTASGGPSCPAVAPGPVERGQRRLSFTRVLAMNAGFLGLQCSFGLQQSNMAPILSELGATTAALPLLTIAGPVTGLVVQPLVGMLSDRTRTRWGRRTPYFVAGTVASSACLTLMPFSTSIWMAVVLLWILDTATNTAMQPYRAYVSDRLPPFQRSMGFLTQSAFTGLAQTLAYLLPSLMLLAGIGRDAVAVNGVPTLTVAAFLLGAAVSLVAVGISAVAVPEAASILEPAARRAAPLRELGAAIREMPLVMRQMAAMSLFQWYGMMCYWTYVPYAIARNVYGDAAPGTSGFRQAVLDNGQIGAFYNAIAAVAAFAMVPLARRRPVHRLHAASLVCAGLSMLAVAAIGQKLLLFPAVIGIGIGWGSMMGNPYAILAAAIPPERTGIYMGLFNVLIVLPMILFGLTMPAILRFLFAGSPDNAIAAGGACMLVAALLANRLPTPSSC